MSRRGPLIGGDNTILDPEYAFADDAGDPLGARNRATVEGQRADAKDAAQQERDRQLQFLLAQYGQDQQNARLAYTTHADQQTQAQRQAVEARGQDLTAQGFAADRAQRLSPYDMKDPKTGQVVGKLPWSVLESYGHAAQQEQELGERARQFDTSEERRGYEFDTQQQRKDYEFDTEQGRRGYEFETNRQPSERDQFQGDLQSQHMQEQAQLHAWTQQQELTNTEQSLLQRRKNSVALVNEALGKGEIDQDTASRAIAKLKTDIDPLDTRQHNAQMAHMQMQDQLLLHQAAKQAQIEEQNAQFSAKTFAERVGQYKDENGMIWRGFQTAQGHWEVHNPYEQQQKEREHLFKMQQQTDTKNEGLKSRFEGRLESSLKQTKSQWQSDFTNTSRAVDKEIHDAEMKADKPAFDASDEQKAAEKSWVAKLKANRDTMIHDRMTQIKRWSQFGADKDALDAALEQQKQEQLDAWQSPLQRPETPQPAPTGEKPNSFGGQRLAQPETINPPSWQNAGEPAPGPQAVMNQPNDPYAQAQQQPAPPQAAPVGIAPQARQAALAEFDNIAPRFQSGKEAEQLATARALFEKYGSLQNMPPEERTQFIGIMTNLKRLMTPR